MKKTVLYSKSWTIFHWEVLHHHPSTEKIDIMPHELRKWESEFTVEWQRVCLFSSDCQTALGHDSMNECRNVEVEKGNLRLGSVVSAHQLFLFFFSFNSDPGNFHMLETPSKLHSLPLVVTSAAELFENLCQRTSNKHSKIYHRRAFEMSKQLAELLSV